MAARAFVVTLTQNNQIMHLFNIIEILINSKYLNIIESENLVITST